ncbi:hypothetical protein HJG54_21630 [Leptolyngbya sp. NK1-12]|uniref:Uncharacterized protein n=1 Tax=Leptolyngbya sp. NK1-12 TaxID=2547451 RepID=A0AA96WHG6_9CYAN|nr:GDSL-type esterase/lipase family protein [Leptolyngbya sp. NK1-12]WNZ25195.1 hypothetical protein HJG54_21630 [Leptolyngbya sp. NK1-12]
MQRPRFRQYILGSFLIVLILASIAKVAVGQTGISIPDLQLREQEVRTRVESVITNLRQQARPKITRFDVVACSSSNRQCNTEARDVFGYQMVLLKPKVSGNVTHYMVSESPNFSGARWQTYKNEILYILSSGITEKTIYFKVKGPDPFPLTIEPEDGREVVRDPITGRPIVRIPIRPPVAQELFSDVTTARYAVQGKLYIASIGDSYAAGEGAPERNWSTGAVTWISEQCHRSKHNSRNVAVNDLKTLLSRSGSKIQIEFGDFSCSGATINVGLLGPYGGVPHGYEVRPALPPQIDQLRDWLIEKQAPRLDILIVGVGGNDVGFGAAIESCLGPLTPLGCDNDKRLLEWVTRGAPENNTILIGAENLQEAYNRLAKKIEELNPRYVLITEYPNPGLKGRNQYCGKNAIGLGGFGDNFTVAPQHYTYGQLIGYELPPLLWNYPVGASMEHLFAAESEWIERNILRPLNRTVAAAVSDNRNQGWILVDNIANSFVGHSICQGSIDTDDAISENLRWVNTFRDSVTIQKDPYGSVHPNWSGYKRIANRLLDRLKPLIIP